MLQAPSGVGTAWKWAASQTDIQATTRAVRENEATRCLVALGAVWAPEPGGSASHEKSASEWKTKVLPLRPPLQLK